MSGISLKLSKCLNSFFLQYCVDCSLHYCVGCHRNTHANPFGVRQKAKATQKEYSDHGAMLWMLIINNTPTIHTYIHTYMNSRLQFVLRVQNSCCAYTIVGINGLLPSFCSVSYVFPKPFSQEFVAINAPKIFVDRVVEGMSLYLIIFFSILHFFNVLVAG